MKVSSHTSIINHHSIEIDDVEYATTFEVNEFIEPKVEVDGNKTTITYATQDDFPINPRDFYDHAGTMVVTGNKHDYSIDDPESDISELMEVADDLITHKHHGAIEVYFVTQCHCRSPWNQAHDLEAVQVPVDAGECPDTHDVLIFGNDEDTYPDGSTTGYEIPLDGWGELESREGVAAMLDAIMDGSGWTTMEDLAKAYIEVARPDITAFTEWSAQGYSQGDWAKGYAYMTATDFPDPEAALEAEIEEYKDYFRGDVYVAVQETYTDGEQDDYECCGGFFGDAHITATIEEGAFR